MNRLNSIILLNLWKILGIIGTQHESLIINLVNTPAYFVVEDVPLIFRMEKSLGWFQLSLFSVNKLL